MDYEYGISESRTYTLQTQNPEPLNNSRPAFHDSQLTIGDLRFTIYD
ncbi:MAG TPA: hypothetical protein VF985_08590 [Mariniflexile sp.]